MICNKTMRVCNVCTVDMPIISLTMSVTREYLRQEILAIKVCSKDSTNDDCSDESISYCDLEAELSKIREMLPQQYEISGLELLHNNSNNDDDSDSNTCNEEEDFSYDSSQVDSILLSHSRIENKVIENNKKISDSGGSMCSTNINSSEASISSNIDHDISKGRLLGNSDRSISLGSYACNSIDATRNKPLKVPSILYTQRRLSVYSDHTNETDDDDDNDADANVADGPNMVLKQYHTFEVPLQPLHSYKSTTTSMERRKQFQMSVSSDSSESNTLSSSYANDSFHQQITAIASARNSLGSKVFNDSSRQSITSLSAEMIETDRLGGTNRAA